ncbi:MAG TPA: O-antigen ligase family protein, partial [Spirochaetota bacterium]|nr:O-antigen ligase family protein [Spirochaetota bacterium]
EGGLRLFRQYPIFGAGLGSVYASSFKMNNLFYIYSDSNSFKHSHCEYVEVLGEAGIFGIIFFIALFGFIVVYLMSIAYSKKYNKDFRYISMALAVGIVSMLIHQLFSLSFRMSVTQTAYFSLLGLGVFLISLRKSMVIDGFTLKKSIFPEFLNKSISFRGKYILLGIMTVFTILGIIGFSMTFRSEYNIRKALGSRSINEARYYFNRAVTVMPGNPYAWTQKYSVDFNYYQQLLKSFQNSQDYFKNVEQEFNVVKTDLDKLNGIIPGYQDVYSKYANLYLATYDYKIRKYSVTSNLSDYKDGIKYLYEANNHLTSSLNMNFLNENNHIIRLLLQNILNIESQYKDYVKDYAMARVYLDLGRGRKVVKEKIKINFTDADKTSVVKENEIYNINISENDIHSITNSTKGIKNISELKTKLDSELKAIFIYE